MNCQRGRLLVFLLANSWVGQNSRSIELYFLFYFRMDCSCDADRAEPTKIEDRANQPRSDRSDAMADRSDRKLSQLIRSDLRPIDRVSVNWDCPIDRTAAQIWEVSFSDCEVVSF